MLGLRPFFTFFGGKWRTAPRYPEPRYGVVVEPFAGAAGYSLRHYGRDVVLCEADEVLAALWAWLVRATRAEILALPLLALGQSVADLEVIPEARTLIGFWLNKGTTHPCRVPSRWMREGLRPKSYWGVEIRERIASQVERIRHWRVVPGGYEQSAKYLSDRGCLDATWFVDPPYNNAAGCRYRVHAVDYGALATWCRGLRGQVIVCENVGATWLPFRPHLTAKGMESRMRRGVSEEAIWTSDDGV